MYQDHFGLHADPFALSPSLRFLYRSQAHAETMAHLGYGLEQGEDIILISGAIGTGKTLALQNLQAKVSGLFSQVLVNVTRVSYIEFLKLVLSEMGESWPPGSDTADLLVLMKKRALAVHERGRKVLLVVDEAQNLDVETLEGVRLLTNMGQPDKQLFQIVLAGQPALEQLVNQPELAQLRQRIRVHYRLEPLSPRETVEYINHRTSVAGGLRPLFTAAAIRRIHELSGGIPRLVNHLASHAMLAAFVEQDREVDARHVAAEGLPDTPAPTADAPSPEAVGVARGEPAEPEPVPDARPERPAAASASIPASRTEVARPRRRRGWYWAWGVVLVAALVVTWFVLEQDTGAVPGLVSSRPAGPAVAGDDPDPVAQAERQPEVSTPAEEDRRASADLEGAPSIVGPDDSGPADPSWTADDEAPRSGAAVTPVTELDARPVAARPSIWLHVASFRDAARADRMVSMLGEVGAPARQRSVTLADGGSWVRVLVGPFDDRTVAEAMADRLQTQGLITFHRQIEE
ncbi:AAA family ATPase [bacterium]|nr:AAA family ATPase [bacterium]